MIDQEKINRWSKVVEEATPGPWESPAEYEEGGEQERKVHISYDVSEGRYAYFLTTEDGTFLSIAREALPDLLEERKEMQREIEQLRGKVGDLPAPETVPQRVKRILDEMESDWADLAASWFSNEATLTREFAADLAERERLLEMLREVEWSGSEDGFNSFCHICRGMKPEDYDVTRPSDERYYRGHTPDCRLDARLHKRYETESRG